MCGRFTLSWSDYNKLAKELEAQVSADDGARHEARYNIAPTQNHWVVKQVDGVATMSWARWGLINSWAKNKKAAARQINARADRVITAPAYRAAFRQRRCIVPVDGFYEWTGKKGAKQPVWFHPAEGGLLRLAGLYETWRDPTSSEKWQTFTVLTTEPNAVTEAFHNRMPVILDKQGAATWISEQQDVTDDVIKKLKTLMCPAPDDLLGYRLVNRAVGNVRNEGPDMLTEVEPLPVQLTLA